MGKSRRAIAKFFLTRAELAQKLKDEGTDEKFAEIIGDVIEVINKALIVLVEKGQEVSKDEVLAAIQKAIKDDTGVIEEVTIHDEIISDLTDAINKCIEEESVEDYIKKFSE